MSNNIVLALDGLNKSRALELTDKIGRFCAAVKGHDIFDIYGRGFVADLKAAGARKVWVDYKLHDTPDTVALRAAALRDHQADIVTVHASGGIEMMKRAVDTGITVYAVTVLTSLTEHDCQDYYNRDTIDQVVRLAGRAAAAGVHGIVSSPQELAPLRKMFPANPLLVTPGTRSPGVAAGSQKRITTPLEAIRAGCDQLVVGSEITKDYDPIAAYIRLTDSIK